MYRSSGKPGRPPPNLKVVVRSASPILRAKTRNRPPTVPGCLGIALAGTALLHRRGAGSSWMCPGFPSRHHLCRRLPRRPCPGALLRPAPRHLHWSGPARGYRLCSCWAATAGLVTALGGPTSSWSSSSTILPKPPKSFPFPGICTLNFRLKQTPTRSIPSTIGASSSGLAAALNCSAKSFTSTWVSRLNCLPGSSSPVLRTL